MVRSRRVDRGFEIVAQSRAERGLVALLDRDLVDGRGPEVAGGGGDELGEGARLGFEPLRLALGLVEWLAQAIFRLAGGCEGLARLDHRFFGFLSGFLGDRRFLAQVVEGRSVLGRGGERRDLALEALLLGSETGGALHLLAHGALQGGAAGVEIGGLGLEGA